MAPALRGPNQTHFLTLQGKKKLYQLEILKDIIIIFQTNLFLAQRGKKKLGASRDFNNFHPNLFLDPTGGSNPAGPYPNSVGQD